MKTNQMLMIGFWTLTVSSLAIGCKPKTAGQKVEDKMEDARHEINQGAERVGENIKDATSNSK